MITYRISDIHNGALPKEISKIFGKADPLVIFLTEIKGNLAEEVEKALGTLEPDVPVLLMIHSGGGQLGPACGATALLSVLS